MYKLPLEFISRELKTGSEHTSVDLCNFAREVCIGILKADNVTLVGQVLKWKKMNKYLESATIIEGKELTEFGCSMGLRG